MDSTPPTFFYLITTCARCIFFGNDFRNSVAKTLSSFYLLLSTAEFIEFNKKCRVYSLMLIVESLFTLRTNLMELGEKTSEMTYPNLSDENLYVSHKSI